MVPAEIKKCKINYKDEIEQEIEVTPELGKVKEKEDLDWLVLPPNMMTVHML